MKRKRRREAFNQAFNKVIRCNKGRITKKSLITLINIEIYDMKGLYSYISSTAELSSLLRPYFNNGIITKKSSDYFIN